MRRKPIEVAHRDFVDTLTHVINSSDLPAFIVAQSLMIVLNDVKAIEDASYKKALEEYNAQEESEEEDNG